MPVHLLIFFSDSLMQVFGLYLQNSIRKCANLLCCRVAAFLLRNLHVVEAAHQAVCTKLCCIRFHSGFVAVACVCWLIVAENLICV